MDAREVRRTRALTLGRTLLFVAFLGSIGCATSAPVDRVARGFEEEYPGIRLEQESHVKLGRFTMAVVRGVASLAGDDTLDDEAAVALRSARFVEVTSYRVRGAQESGQRRGSLARVERRLERQGWVSVVRERDGDDTTWVFFRAEPDGEMRGVFVVSYDGSELEVVRVEGRHLDRVLAEAMRDDPENAAELFGS